MRPAVVGRDVAHLELGLVHPVVAEVLPPPAQVEDRIVAAAAQVQRVVAVLRRHPAVEGGLAVEVELQLAGAVGRAEVEPQVGLRVREAGAAHLPDAAVELHLVAGGV
ncbi:MAG: hypothetical protein ACK559_08935, partial [bacterium]